MLNVITIAGRLVRDPEQRTTNSGLAVTSFTVACDRDTKNGEGQKEADFIDCTAWRQTAEFVSKYFQKGSMILVSGRLQSERWEDKDGNKRTSWKIVANSVWFGGSKKDGDGQQQEPQAYPQQQYQQPQQQRQQRPATQPAPQAQQPRSAQVPRTQQPNPYPTYAPPAEQYSDYGGFSDLGPVSEELPF